MSLREKFGPHTVGSKARIRDIGRAPQPVGEGVIRSSTGKSEVYTLTELEGRRQWSRVDGTLTFSRLSEIRDRAWRLGGVLQTEGVTYWKHVDEPTGKNARITLRSSAGKRTFTRDGDDDAPWVEGFCGSRRGVALTWGALVSQADENGDTLEIITYGGKEPEKKPEEAQPWGVESVTTAFTHTISTADIAGKHIGQKACYKNGDVVVIAPVDEIRFDVDGIYNYGSVDPCRWVYSASVALNGNMYPLRRVRFPADTPDAHPAKN